MSSAQTQYADYITAQQEAAAKGEEFDGKLGDSASAFDKMGISVIDSNGNLRDSEAVFSDAITALGGIKNEAERDALAMEIFGKSAQELNPLIKAGSAELDALGKKAHEVGAVMSEEDVAAFESFDDTLSSLKMGLQGTLGTLAASFLPGFQMVFDQAGGYLQQFKGIIDGSGGDIGKIADGLGGLITQIISDVAAQAPQLMETGLTILMSIVDAIITNLPTMIEAGVGMLLTLVDGLITALPAIIDAGLQAIITLASGITQALPTLIPTLVGVIIQIVNVILENLPMIIEAALNLIIALALGLVQALPVLIAALPKIITTILNALINALPMIASAAGELIGVLAGGIVVNIPILLAAIVELIVRLGESLANWIQTMPEIGKNLLEGIWKGIQNNAANFREQLKTFFKGIVDNIKSVLGIKSPSSVMADQVGANLPTGIAAGFDSKIPEVRRHLARSMLGLTSDLKASISAPGVAGAGVSASAGMGAQISIGDIIVNVPGTTATAQQIGIAVQNGLLKSLRAIGAA